MHTTTIRSGVHPTAELASAHIGGLDAMVGKGQKAHIVQTDVIEVEGGFEAIAYIKIEEAAATEEETTKGGGGSGDGGGGGGAKKPGLGYIAALQPKPLFPATQAPGPVKGPPVPDAGKPSALAAHRLDEMQAQSVEGDASPSEMTFGPETLTSEANELSVKLENDFEVAEEPSAKIDQAAIHPDHAPVHNTADLGEELQHDFQDAEETPANAPYPTDEEKRLTEEERLRRRHDPNNDLQLDIE